MVNKPYCCYINDEDEPCENDAEYAVFGSSNHFEDVTEACTMHVGFLLGTPLWLDEHNEHWRVYPITEEK